MQHYDLTLKLLFESRPTQVLRELAGTDVRNWLNVEFRRFQSLCADLLGETTARELIQIELQSANDPWMAVRMAEYSLAIYRRFRRFPRQIVVYVGSKPVSMPRTLPHPHNFEYELVDIRKLDGDRLLRSQSVSDNVIGILARVADTRRALKRVLERIASLTPAARVTYLKALFVVAGLRGLEPLVEKEASKVPVFIDILENKVLGREYKRGLAEGKAEGKAEGQHAIVRRMMRRRFGPIPAWADQRLKTASTRQLERWADQLLDAKSLKQLLGDGVKRAS